MQKISLSLFILLSLTSFAQADEELDTLLAMSLEELLNVEITSSSYVKENIYTVPSSVTVFTYEQIEKMNVNSLEELMNYVPGFQSNRAATYTNQYDAHVRGGLGENNILVLYDGQRLNMDWGGSAMIRNQLLSLENVERIEFIKGPGSALYGSNAFTGVVNIFTKKDLNNIGTRFKENYVNAYLNYAYNEDDLRISSFIKGIYDKGEEYSSELDSYTGAYRNPKDKNSGSEAYVNAQYKNVSLQLRHMRRDTQGWYALGFNSDQSDTYVSEDFMRLGYTYDNISSFTSELFLSYVQGEGESDFSFLPGLLSTAIVKEESIEVQWQNSYHVNAFNTVHFGAEYRHPELTEASLKNGVAPTDIIAHLGARDIYGLYAQYQGHFSDIRLTLGARYDNYSDFGSTFNPRLAAVYQPFEDTSFKLLYGSAFSAPTQSELLLKNNAVTSGNPKLQPETIQTYEAILIQKIVSSSLSLSYFDSRIQDTIVSAFDNGVLTFANLGDKRFSGIEVELLSEFLNNTLTTRFGASHILHSDEAVQSTPETTASAIVNYRYDKFNFNLNGFYHSSTENDYTSSVKTLDAYTLVNTKVQYFISSDLSAYFEMQNIFDEEYTTPSIVGSPPFDVSNRGRLSYLGLKYSF